MTDGKKRHGVVGSWDPKTGSGFVESGGGFGDTPLLVADIAPGDRGLVERGTWLEYEIDSDGAAVKVNVVEADNF